jgi:hypothetical protein
MVPAAGEVVEGGGPAAVDAVAVDAAAVDGAAVDAAVDGAGGGGGVLFGSTLPSLSTPVKNPIDY